ncbi:hypothetical protein R1sor_003208 [Riccia sorocarpa]|uniref:BHLH domain-containing protein n=1 Tax=Riccia sorocarpa TaxID=122646 RepID=A0ABD3H340_9MARC
MERPLRASLRRQKTLNTPSRELTRIRADCIQIGKEKAATLGPGKRREHVESSVAYLQLMLDTLTQDLRRRAIDSSRLGIAQQLSEGTLSRPLPSSDQSDSQQLLLEDSDADSATVDRENTSRTTSGTPNLIEALAQLGFVECERLQFGLPEACHFCEAGALPLHLSRSRVVQSSKRPVHPYRM